MGKSREDLTNKKFNNNRILFTLDVIDEKSENKPRRPIDSLGSNENFE